MKDRILETGCVKGLQEKEAAEDDRVAVDLEQGNSIIIKMR